MKNSTIGGTTANTILRMASTSLILVPRILKSRTMTVSNVINGNYAKVSKECIDRVKAIIQKHGYVPNSSARSLAAKSSRIIAGIIAGPPDANLLTDGYVAQFFGAVSKR
jgi:DNA-binding LacI/PurR family transcriptional regulator